MNKALLFLNDTKLAELNDKLETMTANERNELSAHLSGVMEQAARVKGYIEGRYMYNKRDHSAAVKFSNKLAERVRKVLGFAYPKQDLSF